MKPRLLLSIALLLLAGVGLAGEPPARIGLQAPSTMKPGEASHLTVSLVGRKGEPVPSPQDLRIEIRGAGPLGAPVQVAIPAGSASVDVAVRAPKPGLWQIEASSPGLTSGYAVVACVDAARRVTATLPPVRPKVENKEEKAERKIQLPTSIFREHRHGRIETRTEAAPPPPPPVPSATTAEASPGSDTAPRAGLSPGPARSGHVELIAQPPKLRRGRGGWGESQVVAFWFEGDAPGPTAAPLSMSLVMDGGTGDTEVNPTVLSIPSGQFQSPGAARISARRADKAVIKALYAGGQSKPVEVDFLQAEPTHLGFVGAAQTFRGLTSVDTDLYVRLLDDDGEPATTAEPRKVNVAVQGPTGVRSYPATLPASETQVKVPVELVRPGTYSIVASAPGVQDSAPLAVRFALDWLLLASSLLGGTLGSLTRVLYRRERVWPKGLPRILALGLAAALLVLLLSLFGVLSVLGDALPAAEALQKVSATNLAGALLLGFIAGLVFDQILGRFLGGTKGRRARPKSTAPAPKPGPA